MSSRVADFKEYELSQADPDPDPEEFDMSEMDESFRGLRDGEDSIANKPVDRLSKNKNLNIFNNISSENVPGGQHNNSNSFNKISNS